LLSTYPVAKRSESQSYRMSLQECARPIWL
jgi:hypothetical protein